MQLILRGSKKLISSVFFLLLLSCLSNEKRQYTLTGFALGTPFKIIYFSSSENQSIEKSMDSIFNEINQSMSTYIPSSDISKINDGNTSIIVDDHFVKVFKKSKEIWKISEGFFDPTAGIITKANGLGPKDNSISNNDIQSLLNLTGFKKVQIKNRRIIKENKNIFLDFNAIAKGYCVDVIGQFFKNKKINNFLIEIGGEMVAKGKNLTSNSPWKVAIIDPINPDSKDFFKKILLVDRAMASSGNYRKYKIDEKSGNKIVHTVNPKNGQSIETNVAGVTVLAEDCMSADALATAFMVMPIKKSLEIISKNKEIDALIIYFDKNRKLQTFSSAGFDMVSSN